ncbi:peptidase [Ammoniphilus oxalaticus]|uniref:Peptidase n=1 Tax=Ammoniphilus oxalaticus TaxID=66863 RepID=A0A419SFN5_9BACL|nr:ImmA/IrrE family metallo-endopeptidase [Ammoniphilus oxalaticus]RKD22587.1 peptidase [Ammoniphilus oxalaticus]
MKVIYTPTHLEEWVSRLYLRQRIREPHDICEESICRFLDIFLFYKEAPSLAFESGRFKSITINSRLPKRKQRERFYHELCHLLRHVGWQLMLPKAFKELQEYDSQNFTRYAAIPFHMLKYFDFRDPNIIPLMADRFKVTEELCNERLSMIKNSLIMNNKILERT